jgi:hypothetical protein
MNSNLLETNYSNETVYFISYAKLPDNMTAGLMHKIVGLGMVINYKTGVIEDISCTLMTSVAKRFLDDVFIGYNLMDQGVEPLVEQVKFRFHGNSQKSLCVVVKENYKRFIDWKKKNNM